MSEIGPAVAVAALFRPTPLAASDDELTETLIGLFRPGPHDRRMTRVHLTDEGEALTDQFQQAISAALTAPLGSWSGARRPARQPRPSAPRHRLGDTSLIPARSEPWALDRLVAAIRVHG